MGMKARGMKEAGDEGSDGVETPSNEDGRAQGGARTEGAGRAQGEARQGAGMGARRARGRRGDDAKVLIIRGMEIG